MPSPISSPDILSEISELRKELELMKRAPRWRGVTFPAVPLGASRPFGFTSLDTTSYTDLFRSDVLLTAPILDYDIQTTNVYESTAVTSIEWRITATAYFDPSGGGIVTAVVASGSSNAASWSGGYEQFSGEVDVTEDGFLGPAALFRFVSFRFECKRTGGSGDGAGLRLVRPSILRVPS